MTRARARSPTQPCKVCRLPPSEADLVTGGLLSGWSPRRLAERFNSLSRRDVRNHAKMCVNEQEEKEA